MNEYPRVLEAVASAEMSLWPVVDAVVAEIASTEKGSARNGEYERCAAYLSDNGFATWSPRRLRDYRDVGRWIEQFDGPAVEFTRHPFEWVYEAKRAAKDHEKALALLATVSSKRAIRNPDRPAPRSREQIVEEIRRDPGVAAEALRDKEVARKVVADPEAGMRLRAADAERAAASDVAERVERSTQEAALGQEERDGLALTRINGAALRVVLAGVAFGKVWKEEVDGLSEEAREIAVEMIATQQARVMAIMDAARGADLDSVLAQILSETESA